MIINNPQANNIFKDFPDFKLGQPPIGLNSSLLSQKPDQVDIKNTSNDSQKLAAVKVSDLESDKKGKGGVIAATVGSTVLIAGIAALFLSNGFSGGMYKKIRKLSEKLADSAKFSEKSQNSMAKVKLGLAKGFRKFLSGMQAASNFNAIKDSFIQKLFNTNKVTERIAKKTTELFKKFSYDSVYSAYDKVHLNTDNFCGDLRHLIEGIKNDKTIDLAQKIETKDGDKTLGVVLDSLEQYLRNTKVAFETGFCRNALLARKDIREDNVEGLLDEVWNTIHKDDGGWANFKDNRSKYKTYITNRLRETKKDKLGEQIDISRKKLTNNIEHNCKFVNNKLDEISDKLKLNDAEPRVFINKLLKNMENYNGLSGTAEKKDRDANVKEIMKNIKSFKDFINSSSTKYGAEDIESISRKLDDIEKTLVKDEKGQLEEVITLLRPITDHVKNGKDSKLLKHFDNKVFNSFNKRAKAISKDITKAAELERDDLHEKCAEFAVGSAPSDLVSFLLPVGVAGYAISKGKDKDERVSATLTTGIPIVGSIGTMMYGTVRMFTGAKNIAFGFGTGLILGILGSTCDKLYKSYREKRSFTKMAVEAYKNNPLLSQANKNNLT